MNILFVGDIFGSPGRKIVREHLHHVVETNHVELIVMNAENSACGFGVTPAIAEELFEKATLEGFYNMTLPVPTAPPDVLYKPPISGG